jgi:hypothetical protein
VGCKWYLLCQFRFILLKDKSCPTRSWQSISYLYARLDTWDDETYSEEINENKRCQYFMFPSCISFFLSFCFIHRYFFFIPSFFFFSIFLPFILSVPRVQKPLSVVHYKTGEQVSLSKISAVKFFQLFFNCLCTNTWGRNACVLPTS